MDIQIRQVTHIGELEQIYKLRANVWSQVRGINLDSFPDNKWYDEHDEHAVNWAVFSGTNIVAAARMCIHDRLSYVPDFRSSHCYPLIPSPIASLNRLVVHPSVRGNGIAAQLDVLRISEAIRSDCRSAVVFWSEVSGEKRKAALEYQGFRQTCYSYSDGPFGLFILFILDLHNKGI